MRCAWILGVASCLGCSSAPGAPSTGGTTATALSARPAIGALETRDRKLLLFAAPDGLKVTLEDDSGAILAKEISLEELRDRDALLYELCRSAVAQNGAYLDARVDQVLDGL
jgi:hypothetical protein